MRPKFEVGQIIRDWGQQFFSKYPVVSQVKKSFGAMSVCRTKALGGHVEECPECGERRISYNSCRDRHCPKCQNKEREIWLEKRKEEIIPRATYFHMVFTIPDCLHSIAISHQELFYSCMFRCAWNTLRAFFNNVGLQGGMTCILHTWGSNIFYHPHIHCIVTGGGVDKKGVWHHLKGYGGYRKGFLFPVRAISRKFRGNFISMLTSELKDAGEKIPQDIRKACFEKDWVVYSKPPAKGVDQILEYIARYAYRTAISNSRILDYSPDGMVVYDWKDYRDEGKHKKCSVHALDFLHLFSLHILPPHFVRIRQYGLMSPSKRNELKKVQIQLSGTPVPERQTKKSYLQICHEKGWTIGFCPHCGHKMVIVETIEPERAPPRRFAQSALSTFNIHNN